LPGTVAVMLPLLDELVLFTAAFSLNEPLPVLFAGVIFVIVSHCCVWLVRFHCSPAVAVTFTVTHALPASVLHDVRDKLICGVLNGSMSAP